MLIVFKSGFICVVTLPEGRILQITGIPRPTGVESGTDQESLLRALAAGSIRAANLAQSTHDSYLPAAGTPEDFFPLFFQEERTSVIGYDAFPCKGIIVESFYGFGFPMRQLRYSELALVLQGIANITRVSRTSENNTIAGLVNTYFGGATQGTFELGEYVLLDLPFSETFVPYHRLFDYGDRLICDDRRWYPNGDQSLDREVKTARY